MALQSLQQILISTALSLPHTAHLDYSGNDLTCDDGLQKQRAECTAK
jgi:hypothetical protein